jgi:hypothetical protein
MVEDPPNAGFAPDVEVASLEAMLAQGDAVLGTIAPILRHLLAHDDHSVFSDEIVARVRGMACDVARQLLESLGQEGMVSGGDVDALAEVLTATPAFLCHVHAQALEWQLTERLQDHLGLDPVLSPLLQALIGSSDAATSGVAMKLLAAQARFGQGQRRMQLPLGELPGDLLHGVLLALRTYTGTRAEADARGESAEQTIRRDYDESAGRLGLISCVVSGMGGGMIAALSVGHAGAAIFLTALAAASGQDRDTTALATSEGQAARLALALRAAGLKQQALEEQFLALNPDGLMPEGLDRLGPERAAELLSAPGGFSRT